MFPKAKVLKKTIYLDHAATTPVDPSVVKDMSPFWRQSFGNPSSLYKQGTLAKSVIESSRKKIADVIGARSTEIIFTAGGTESCNLAIFGAARINTDFKTDKSSFASNFAKASSDLQKATADRHGSPHIITSAIEHHAVLRPIEALKGEGFKVTVLDVNSDGLVNISDLQKAIRPETILVSIMYANNEIGTVQPIAEAGKLVSRINTNRGRNGLTRILFHTDACQAAGSLDLNVQPLGVDLMSVNGSKIYGPKQTGFLFVRNGVNLKPLIYGGGQERGLRSGTENVAGIVGLAKALELASEVGESENRRIGLLQRYFISRLLKISGVELNGPGSRVTLGRRKPFVRGLPSVRLSNNVNIIIKGVEGEALMLYLDAYGIAVSTGSACTTGLSDPSHVLLAIGRSQKQAKSSIRFSLGKSTTKAELDYVLKVLPGIIAALRKTKGLR